MTAKIMAGFHPETFVTGGLMLDDCVAKWDDVKFEMFTYKNSDITIPSLGITFVNPDTSEVLDRQNYSCGSKDDWLPEPDGSGMAYIGGGSKSGFTDNCNFALFMAALVNAGFPEDTLRELEDIRGLTGTVTHIIGVPQRDRDGTPRMRKSKEGKDFPVLLFLPDRVDALPGEKTTSGKAKKSTAKTAVGKAKASGAGKKDAKEPAQGDDEVDRACTEVLLAILAKAGDEGISRGKIPTEVLAGHSGHPLRTKLLNRIYSEDFLADSVGALARFSDVFEGAKANPWVFEDGVVTAG